MIVFEPIKFVHWEEVRTIYEEGIKTGNATFEQRAPDWATWNNGHLVTARIIAIEDNQALGWAALSPVSGRCVYRGVAEVSVYVKAGARGNGLGKQLLKKLIEESEANGIWTLQAGIFSENVPSIKVHQACGFRIVGTRERIGKLNGIWRDTLLLERRSNTAGT